MPLHPPAAADVPEIGHSKCHRAVAAVRLGERHVDAGVPEAQDVRPAVARQVHHEPRVLLHPPAACHVPEVVHHAAQRVVAAVGLCPGHVHAGVAEADDVGPAVAGGVGQEPRVLLHPPAACHVREVVHHAAQRVVAAVGLRPGDVHAGVAEADDVGPAVAGGVGQEPRVLLHPPAACLVPEVVHHAAQRIEGAVRLCPRHVHAGVAEADDVGPAVAGGVGQEPRVLLDPPAPCDVAEVVHPRWGTSKRPSDWARDTYAPASPNPTMSARPSPVVSARNRGWRSTCQPPADAP